MQSVRYRVPSVSHWILNINYKIFVLFVLFFVLFLLLLGCCFGFFYFKFVCLFVLLVFVSLFWG